MFTLLYIDGNVHVFTVAQVQTTEHGVKNMNTISEFSTWIKNNTNFGETPMFTVPSRETRVVSQLISFAGITTSDIWLWSLLSTENIGLRTLNQINIYVHGLMFLFYKIFRIVNELISIDIYLAYIIHRISTYLK